MRFSKFSPFSKVKAKRSFASRSTNSNPGIVYFSVDRDNFITIETTFQTNEANDWSCAVLNSNDLGRVVFRLFDSRETTVGTLVDLGGYAGLVSAINANALLSKYVKASITGTIANTQDFSESITDNTFFQGAIG